jgi:4-hydroxy-tetrahydrodipicolinate reductase
VIYADEDFDIASGRIPKGTVSGMSFEIRGMVDGEAAGVPFPAPEFNA